MIHSVLFNKKDGWTKKKVVKWLNRYGLCKRLPIQDKSDYFRVLLNTTAEAVAYSIRKMPFGISLIIMDFY
jgi:hypothetical protein